MIHSVEEWKIYSFLKYISWNHLLYIFHTVEFTKFLYHLKIISWNQLFSKLFTKEIVFTEIFQKVVIQKFCKIHSVQRGNTHRKNISSNHLFSNLFSKYYHEIFAKEEWE